MWDQFALPWAEIQVYKNAIFFFFFGRVKPLVYLHCEVSSSLFGLFLPQKTTEIPDHTWVGSAAILTDQSHKKKYD